MGNCQGAEAATVLIQHPGGRLERIYWSLSAGQVMASHPGHYVAVIISSQPPPNLAGAAAPVKHLKLLRSVDTLHIGHVYRLVSFQDVLKDFVTKKHLRLSKIINASKNRGQSRSKTGGGDPASESSGTSPPATEAVPGGNLLAEEAAAPPSRPWQWRPALQSIAEGVGN